LSISTYSTQQCDGEKTRHITESGICYQSESGKSIFVDGLPSNCEVVTYTDEACREEAFTAVHGLGGAKGCYITDAFESIFVKCGALPA